MCPLYPESRGFVASRPSESGECPLRSSSSSSSAPAADRFVIYSVLGYTADATFLARFHRPRSRSRVSIRESKHQRVLLLGIATFRLVFRERCCSSFGNFKRISSIEFEDRAIQVLSLSCEESRYLDPYIW